MMTMINDYYNLSNKSYDIGDVVKVKDGEPGGVFIISGIRCEKGKNGITYTQYRLNETDTWMRGIDLEPFVDKNTVEKMMDWLYGHVNDYLVNDKLKPTDSDRLICKSDMFEDLKHYIYDSIT